jgi:hypothetical protein
MTKDDYTSSILNVFLDQFKKAIIRAIVAKLPFLGISFLNPILVKLVSVAVEAGAKEAQIRAYFVEIDLRTNSQASRFSELAIKYEKERTPENEKLMLNAFYEFASFVR